MCTTKSNNAEQENNRSMSLFNRCTPDEDTAQKNREEKEENKNRRTEEQKNRREEQKNRTEENRREQKNVSIGIH